MFFAGVLVDRGVFDGVRDVRMIFRIVPDIIRMGPRVGIFKFKGDLNPFSRMFFAGVLEDRGVFDGVRNVRMTFRMVPGIIRMGSRIGIFKIKGI